MWVPFLALVFIVVAQRLVGRRSSVDGLVSPITVIAFAIAFYAVTVPVELWIRDETLIGFTGFHLAPEVGTRVLLASILGMVVLYVGYAAVAPRSKSVSLEGTEKSVAAARWMTFLGSLVGVVLLATVFRENVALATDYESNVAQTALGSDSVGYFVVNRWTYLTYAMFVFLSVAKARRPVWTLVVMAVPLVWWSIYSNDKDPLLVAVLAASGLLYSRLQLRGRIPGIVLVLGMVGAMLAMGIGAASFGTQRAGEEVTTESIGEYAEEGLFVNIDPAGPAAVHANVFLSTEAAGSFKPTLTGLIGWIPARLRPIPPQEDLAITFAKQHWPGWRPGMGYGYSPLAEGWQAAGYVGVGLVMLIAGIFFGGARNLLLAGGQRGTGSRAVRVAAYYVVLGYLGFILMRGTLTSLFSTAIVCVVLVAALTLVGNVVARPARSAEAGVGSRGTALGRRANARSAVLNRARMPSKRAR